MNMASSDLFGSYSDPVTENAQLRRIVTKTQAKLEELQDQVNSMAASKIESSRYAYDVGADQVSSTRAMVRLQMENNRLREEAELIKFEYQNKLLALDRELQTCKMDKQKALREVDDLTQAAEALERARRDLADEYIALKTNFMALAAEYRTEISKNEELSLEIVNLVKAKDDASADVPVSSRDRVGPRSRNPLKLRLSQSSLRGHEERLQSALRGYALTVDDSLQDDVYHLPAKTADNVEKKIHSDTKRFREQLARQKSRDDTVLSELAAKLDRVNEELLSAKTQAIKQQSQISKLTARLITTAGENRDLKTSNNHLQHKLKDINSDFGQRLAKYVRDIAHHVDSAYGVAAGDDNSKADEGMAQYINRMLKDMKALHRLREEQLGEAARQSNARVQSVVRQHEELLAAYRELQSEAESRGLAPPVRLAPEPYQLQFTDLDLHTLQEKEIQRLDSELRRLREQMDESLPAAEPPLHQKTEKANVHTQTADFRPPAGIERQELRQLVSTELAAVEAERSALLSRCAALEEQLKASRLYIQKRLRALGANRSDQENKDKGRVNTAPTLLST